MTGTIDYAFPYSVLGMVIGKFMRLDKAFDSYLRSGSENAMKILEGLESIGARACARVYYFF